MNAEARRSWRDALEVYTRAPVVTMLFLGFSAGLPFLLVFSTLTAWLRDVGVEVAAIGFFSWIGITYSIKFAWAPVVDRLPLPGLTRRLGQRRGWMLAGQVAIGGGLAGLAFVDPTAALGPVAALALVVAFGSATQDIAIDAFRIESADDDVQAAMAATYIIGYRAGILVAGAGALHLAAVGSWMLAYLVMAALMGIGIVTVAVRPEPPRRVQHDTRAREERVERYLLASGHLPEWWRRLGAWFVGAVVCPFVDFFARNGRTALTLLLLVAVYKISDLAMAAMANPLYIDLGFELSEIANITKVYGVAMTIVGGLLGGALVARYGIARVLIVGAAAVAATNLLFAVLAETGRSLPMLVVTISGDNLSNGLASAVFIAFLSSMTSRAYTATQYALFSSLMTLPGKFLGGFSGVVVEWQGYPAFFVLAALMGIPAIILAFWVAKTGAGIQQHPDAVAEGRA
ncbi:MAG: AmpG family muropeptide MFS transporter [Halofilum sp. (in: g-proteobacteria)]|nr:AmpG family muropeptide MFS transporter [Halofilum sp. (in: g-proteobacteria)]